MAVIDDVLILIEFLASQKTLPDRPHAALQRLREHAARKLPLDVTVTEPSGFQHPGEAQSRFP